MGEMIYGTLRIYGFLTYKTLHGKCKVTRKPVCLETHHCVTAAQARGLVADFKGQNSDITEDISGKWVSDCEWIS